MLQADADATISGVDSLRVGIVSHAYSDTVLAGLVISQNPVGGTAVAIGSSVDIIVSLGQSVVPDVVGETEGDANTLITAVDLVVGVVVYQYSDTIPAGEVISQNPVGGTTALIGTPVDLVVSAVIVPNVVGQMQTDANSVVIGGGLTVGDLTYEYNDTITAGIVLQQSPDGNTIAALGSEVDMLVSAGRPTVPDLVSLTQADANAALSSVTLTVGTMTYEYNDTIASGIVLQQSPSAGTVVLVGSSVDIVVSLGRPMVPYVTGMTQAEANSVITSIDSLTVGVITSQYSDTITAGLITGQNPSAGTLVAIGTAIDLAASLGQPAVPNTVGMTQAEATAAITSVDNLQVGSITSVLHDIVPAGRVISQSPSGGTNVLTGSSVDLVISLGQPVVPNVIGLNQSIAKQNIKNAGLSVGTVIFGYSDIIPNNDIMSQGIAAGTIVPIGTPVDLVISFGPPEVPYIVGSTEADANIFITSVSLVTGTVVYEYNDVVAARLVMRQNPEEYTIVSVGSAVDMVVSLGQPVVPNVVGLTETDANSSITSVSLSMGLVTYEYNDTIPAPLVIRQDPNGGIRAPIGSNVNIVVSLGQPIVPNVVGMTEANANSAISSVDNLSMGNITYEYNNTVTSGFVISQDPNGGTAVAIGSKVDILVSLGKPIVPNVLGMAEADANSAVTDVTLSLSSVTYDYSATVAPGHVISQLPSGGTEVLVSSMVDIVIAYAVVPRVIDLRKGDANSAITDAYLVIGTSSYQYSDTIPAGVVISQNPTEGTMVQVGQEVNLSVSLGEPLVGIILGGDRLVEQQNADGGWERPLKDSDPNNNSGDVKTFGMTTIGLAQAYRRTGDANMLAALEQAKGFLLGKTDNFEVSDVLAAVELDSILDDSNCVDYVRSHFYDKLSAGAYYVVDTNTTYDTNSYVESLRDKRAAEGIANLAAWDIGVGLYSAYVIGADTQLWLAGLKAEIDELNADQPYDVLGLAGAVLGLAGTGADYDPQAGSHASASDVNDLADTLAKYQLPTGGFTWHWMFRGDYMDESLRETVYAVVALAKLDREHYVTEINDAVNYLQSVQLATGGWENYTYSGENNEITGEAVRAISIILPIRGDFNNDGSVDLGDYVIFASAWLSKAGDASWNPVCDVADPGDGVIDMFDLAVFVENWLGTIR